MKAWSRRLSRNQSFQGLIIISYKWERILCTVYAMHSVSKNRSQSLFQDSMKSSPIWKTVCLLGFQEKVFLLLSLGWDRLCRNDIKIFLPPVFDWHNLSATPTEYDTILQERGISLLLEEIFGTSWNISLSYMCLCVWQKINSAAGLLGCIFLHTEILIAVFIIA